MATMSQSPSEDYLLSNSAMFPSVWLKTQIVSIPFRGLSPFQRCGNSASPRRALSCLNPLPRIISFPTGERLRLRR